MKTFTTLASLTLIAASSTIAAPTTRSTPQSQSIRTVRQFANGTWIENFTFRPNGQIIATDLSGSRLYIVDQFAAHPPANLSALYTFPPNTALTGITEVEPDVYYFGGDSNSDVANFYFPLNATTIYRLDLRTNTTHPTTPSPTPHPIATLNNVGVVNGMYALSASKGQVLLADSIYGIIWVLNVWTGVCEPLINDPHLKNDPNATTPFGVNGVKVVGDRLYFSNLDQAIVGYFPIDCDGRPTGPAVVFPATVPNADDFDVGPDGSVWLAENVSNMVVRVWPNGTTQNVLSVAGPVAAKFGRRNGDHHILYVSTDGLVFGSQGAVRSDGKIVAIDTRLI